MFLKKIVLILFMVFIIFIALSENEKRIERMAEPGKAMLDRKIQDVQDEVKGYIASKKMEYKERLNEQLDRVETKITQLIFDDDVNRPMKTEDPEVIQKSKE